MRIQKRVMTDSSRCSRRLSSVLLAVLVVSFPLQAPAQRNVFNMPQYTETIRITSIEFGTTKARDTYLSGSTYMGNTYGLESDGWTGFAPYRLFSQGRTHSNVCFSIMKNPRNGGRTMAFWGHEYVGFMWHALKYSKYDLLVGPAVMCDLGILYNQQNSNNPVNYEGYVGGGICVDNTFRFSYSGYDMAFQATLYVPLAGLSFAPDYDQPYYYIYRYGGYGKNLHFISPFNNRALTQQMALVLPIKESRLRIGVTVDGLRNYLGGHTHMLLDTMFTVGFATRYQSKKWDR